MISFCIQKGNYVYVYDEKNRQIRSVYGELHGYTGSTYSIKKGNYIYTYGERGNQLSSKYAK